MNSNGVRTLTRIAIMVALATALHVVEAMIPIPYVVPGAKLGLANIVALYAVMTMAPGESLAISFLRTLLGSLLSGTFLNVAYYLSTSGALVSTAVMYRFRKMFGSNLSVIGISVAGSITHNVTQLSWPADSPADRCHVLPAVSTVVRHPYRDFCGNTGRKNHCLHRKLV